MPAAPRCAAIDADVVDMCGESLPFTWCSPAPGRRVANLGEFVGSEWPVLECLGIISGLFDGSRAGDRDEMG